MPDDATGEFLVASVGQDGADGRKLLGVCPGGEDHVATGSEFAEDGSDLGGGFPLTEDDLWEALPFPPKDIDFGEAEVCKPGFFRFIVRHSLDDAPGWCEIKQMELFEDLKRGFRTILADPWWWLKVLIAGFLLINPLLIILGLRMLGAGESGREAEGWEMPAFCGALAFNVLSFWFPLGFTYEVLRRARFSSAAQLPSWGLEHWRTYAIEGSVKLVIAIFTLLLPVGIWMGLCWLVFVKLIGGPSMFLSMMYAPAMLFAIPFCGVGCCRWLDGAGVLDAALNYKRNMEILFSRGKEFMIASLFLTGFNTVACAFIFTIPFAAVFGLCMVDTWFGPIYASSPVNEDNARDSRVAKIIDQYVKR